MRERFSGNRPYSNSRRRFVLGSAVFGGAALLGVDQLLKDGFMLKEPSLEPKPRRINLAIRGVDNNNSVSVDLKTDEKVLQLGNGSFVYYNTDDNLLFQHKNASFKPDFEYMVSHRSANRLYMVKKALELGANGLDMDATDTGSGPILAEHGIVKKVGLGPLELGGVIDRGEIEVRSRIPKTARELIDYIGSKSNPEDPYILTMELKRGNFASRGELKYLVDSICWNQIPTIVFSSNQKAVDNLYGASVEYSNRFPVS